MSRVQSPIERFLGPSATKGGAFGLLRLTPATCSAERVIASLEWQLERVAQHTEGDTLEADEVRLALHAAAAQLLDPAVRRHVMQSLRDESDAGALEAAAPTPSVPAGSRLTGLEQDALKALAVYGGWNKQSLERLKALAHAKGLGPRELAMTLQNLGTRAHRQTAERPPGGAPAAAAQPAAAPAPQPPAAFVDPGARYVRDLLLWIGGVAAVLLMIVVVGALVVSGGSPSGPVAPAPPPTGDQAARPEKAPETGSSHPPSDSPAPSAAAAPRAAPTPKAAPEDEGIIDPQALVRGLAECAAAVRLDPEQGVEQFPGLVRTLSQRWSKLDLAQRRAADTSVLDVVFATANRPEVSDRVIESLATGAAPLAGTGEVQPLEVLPAVWSVGELTRISRERDLPHSVSAAVDLALTNAIGQDRPRTEATFESGASAALRRIPERLLVTTPGAPAHPPEGAKDFSQIIRPWIEALGAVDPADAQLRERMMVDALQGILVSSPEPSQDQRVFDTVQTLVTEIKWRRGGAARPRLLDWFRDPRVSAADLQVVTSTLASRSSAEGVDALMILSSGATPSDRQRLRTAYAKAWGIAESAGEDKVSASWLEATRNELARTSEGMGHIDLLRMAVALSRLNEAARMIWRGESEAAAVVIQSVGDSIPDPPDSNLHLQTTSSVSVGVEGDGQWMAGYQSLGRNTALRLEKLAQMEKYVTSVGPADAEYLMYLACFESPQELRASAQRAVARLSDQPTIVNAALELLPRAPRYSSVATTFESVARATLPSPDEAGWEREARKALVARLLELLAASGDDVTVDDLSRSLFDSYAARAGTVVQEGTDAAADAGASRGVDEAARLEREWRADAEAVAPCEFAPLRLDLIDRRHQGRRRLARGPVQQFAAEQVTTAELMAYVVSAEHPRLADKAKEILDDMAQARRRSTHIFEQMAHTERAMLRLWRLRIVGDAP